jgi:flagellar assembly FapA-like protein
MAEKLNFVSENGNVQLLISEDHFSAYLAIKNDGIISENEIGDLIEKAGLKKILDLSELENKEAKIFNSPFLIARTLTGTLLKINYLFDLNRSYDPDKTKSLSDFNKITRIKADLPLATVELKKSDGDEQFFDVFGNPISDTETMERLARRYLSKKVYYSKEEGKIFAEENGYPYIDDGGNLTIMSEFECNEDLHKLKLEFYGNLIVNGDIDNCKLSVMGNLRVNGKISNCLSNWIMAQGKLEFESADNSLIGSGKDMRFSKSAKYCYIVCDGKILGGDQSTVVGGVVKSSEGIHISNAGSSMPIRTRLEISVLPYVKENLKTLSLKISKVKRKRNQDLTIMVEQQRMLEQIMEKAYISLTSGGIIPAVRIDNKLYKDTWVKIYNKNKGVLKEYINAEITSDKHGLKINLS